MSIIGSNLLTQIVPLSSSARAPAATDMVQGVTQNVSLTQAMLASQANQVALSRGQGYTYGGAGISTTAAGGGVTQGLFTPPPSTPAPSSGSVQAPPAASSSGLIPYTPSNETLCKNAGGTPCLVSGELACLKPGVACPGGTSASSMTVPIAVGAGALLLIMLMR